MSRYIDADLLLAQCRRNPLFEKTEEDKRMIYIERSIIDATPTADVVEVRHGEWLKTNSRLAEMTCSLCGFTYYGEHDVECMSAFCPECGAKMDGKGERNEHFNIK